MDGFKILYRTGDIVYAVPESSKSIDKLKINVDINGFNYFRNRFATPYRFFLKSSIDSGHIIVVAFSIPNVLVGFTRFEYTNQCCLLRSIEINSSYRQKGIGKTLLSAASQYMLGSCIVTRPDNERAQNFFKKLGFIRANHLSGFEKDFDKYLVLPSPKAVNLFGEVAKTYPRIVFPELIKLYEDLQFRLSRGKPVNSNNLEELKKLLDEYGSLLDENNLARMNHLLSDIKKADDT
jgi:GNAT superfamily N-acetyltransferase